MGEFLERKSKNTVNRTLFLKPYSDQYLYGTYENGKAVGRIQYVRLFSIIAIFILLIACINFMNLTTAKASRRLKEIGIKKAVGAQRKTLVYQYVTESVLMAFVSLMIAIGLVEMLLPGFSEITGKQLTLVFSWDVVLAFATITFVTGLIAGSYPALYLSGFKPSQVLRGQINTSVAEQWARKGLVVFQFAMSVIFITSVVVVYKQIEFVQSKNLGYDKNNVVYFEVEGNATEHLDAFIEEVKTLPGVENASSMLGTMVTERVEGGGMIGDMDSRAVNYDLLELLNIEVKEGRTFSRNFASDQNKIILNEAAVETLETKNSIIGSKVLGKEVIGIVKDFHYETLHEPVKPLFFRLEPKASTNILVKIKPGMEDMAIEELQKFYAARNHGYVFNYQFLDQQYQAQYTAEKRVSKLSQYAAALTIVISCLGLFGLAAFTAERRRKEIGIRKVLGSSELGIVSLLSNDFAKMVIVSILIALPVSYFLTSYWLNNFAYRIELKWWYFIGAGASALFIAWLTVAMQTIKAARINPVDSLRSE